MEAQPNLWLPLTEYALRSGMSISTLRRKIKSNTISYKMEEGRYLIRGDELPGSSRALGFSSSDSTEKSTTLTPRSIPASRPAEESRRENTPVPATMHNSPVTSRGELELLREEIRGIQEDNLLRWKALEARVSGIAKKLEFFSEQIAEARMLVKIFEEKLDGRA